ncbi:NADH-quinone oxidoreductase subunit D, partial [Streptomyces daliensis]|nr:NADH-quinone oxidoreductase subunit D [Streptomyces daliensis]
NLSGVLLGLLSAGLAVAGALIGLRRGAPGGHRDEGGPLPWLRRLQSGHIGDYVAWTVAGMALLTVLAAW